MLVRFRHFRMHFFHFPFIHSIRDVFGEWIDSFVIALSHLLLTTLGGWDGLNTFSCSTWGFSFGFGFFYKLKMQYMWHVPISSIHCFYVIKWLSRCIMHRTKGSSFLELRVMVLSFFTSQFFLPIVLTLNVLKAFLIEQRPKISVYPHPGTVLPPPFLAPVV